MKTNRCVVFGGGGFIGSHLVEALVKQNYPVVVFSHKSKTTLENLSKVINSIQFIEGEFADSLSIKRIIKSGDIIFDMIASSVPYSSMELPLEEITNGVLPHLQLIKNACEKNAIKIIYISSGGGVYGNKQKQPIDENSLPQPISPHAIGKLAIEYYLRYFSLIHNIPYVSYRMSNVYGPRQIQKKGFAIIPTLFSSVTQNVRPLLFNRGKLTRDFVYVDDAIKAIILSFNKKNKSNTYNIGSGTQTSLYELWTEITRLTSSKLKPIFKSKRTIDIDKYVLDISLFSKEYNWTPHMNLNEGLDKTWAWIKTQSKLNKTK